MSIFFSPFTYAAAHLGVIALCIVVTMIIGFTWFGVIFMKPWCALSGVMNVPESARKKQMLPATITNIVGVIVQSTVLGAALQDIVSTTEAMSIAAMLWFTFTFTVFMTSYAYGLKSWKLLLIDTLYYLTTWLVMAVIIVKLS